jgi:hypothetical protein
LSAFRESGYNSSSPKIIKTDFKREQYLSADVDKKSLSNFIKIHVSNCNLNIEKGRYLKLPVEQRICQLCHMDVEDEIYAKNHNICFEVYQLLQTKF